MCEVWCGVGHVVVCMWGATCNYCNMSVCRVARVLCVGCGVSIEVIEVSFVWHMVLHVNCVVCSGVFCV